MFKLALSALVAAAGASAQYAPAFPLAHGAPLAYANAPLAYANAPVAYANAPLGYANAYPYAHPQVLAGQPLVHAAPAQAVTYAQPIATPVAAPVQTAYAVPATRVVENAPVVQQVVEKVEKHGYHVEY